MIKFFRKIRQRLFTENKMGKYFLYAIGEILLIVIGLFIAIQLNNLNVDKTIHKRQLKHLRIIKAEMINNLNSLKETEELSLLIWEAERKIISFKDRDVVNEKELSELLRAITFSELIVPLENGALIELFSSGGLKDIENDSIRSVLASWEGRKTALMSQEKHLAKARNDIIGIYIDEGSLRTIIDDNQYIELLKIDVPTNLFSNLHLLKSRTFENAILRHMLLTWYLSYSIYPEIESDIHLLIRLIDVELNKPEK